MACNLLMPSLIPTSSQRPNFNFQHKALARFPISTPTNSSPILRMKRGDLVVAMSGPPSSTSLILAFVLPITLFAGTVFAASRVADRLDEKFLEDLAMNKAMMEENEEGREDGQGEAVVLMNEDGTVVLEEEVAAAAAAAAAAVPRTRNRPRREA